MNANDAAEMEAYARVLAKYREAFREDPPARAWPAIARNEEDMEEDLEEEARRGRLVVRVVPKNEQSGSASGASDGEKLSDELTSAMEGDAATTGAPREARRLPGESDATFELRKKAEGGDADAQCKLGVEHYGAERYEEAVKWFHQAAEQGDADAQYYLGRCYYFSYGHCERDLGKAEHWLAKAVENGYKRSEGLLKEVRELMNLEVAAAEKKTAAAAKKAAAAEKRKAAAAAKTAAKRAKR